MDLQYHKIRRQFLNLEFNGTEAEGVALQHRLSDICDQCILPALEEVFNRLVPPDTFLTIDRLEIDAGIVTIKRLESELSEKITHALTKSLQELSGSGSSASSHGAGNISCKTEGEGISEAFIFFLKNGTLPWSFHLSPDSGFEEMVQHLLREPERFGNTPERIRREVVDVLTSAAARKRLVHQFSPVFLETLLTLISPERSNVLGSLLQWNRSSNVLPIHEVTQRERLLWERAFASLASGSPFTVDMVVLQTQASHSEATGIGEAFIFFLKNGTLPRSFPRFPDSRFEEMVQHVLREPERFGSTPERIRREVVDALASAAARMRLVHQFTPVFLETLFELIAPEDKKVLEGFLQLLRSSEVFVLEAKQLELQLWEGALAALASGSSLTDSVLQNLSAGKQIESLLFDEKKTDTSANALPASLQKEHSELLTDDSGLPSPFQHPDAKEGIYIGHAGLVLLHPFLPQFFRALGIADDETLLQPDKALYLLYFLATGESVAPEYELVLPKILCNISLDAVVESDITLVVDEQEEARALLTAVIRHWEILQNTGIDGLRETFLKRSGKLSQRSDGEWLLQVESKSYDLLLEQLPWGISMIKLPWMSEMLRVEWI